MRHNHNPENLREHFDQLCRAMKRSTIITKEDASLEVLNYMFCVMEQQQNTLNDIVKKLEGVKCQIGQ